MLLLLNAMKNNYSERINCSSTQHNEASKRNDWDRHSIICKMLIVLSCHNLGLHHKFDLDIYIYISLSISLVRRMCLLKGTKNKKQNRQFSTKHSHAIKLLLLILRLNSYCIFFSSEYFYRVVHFGCIVFLVGVIFTYICCHYSLWGTRCSPSFSLALFLTYSSKTAEHSRPQPSKPNLEMLLPIMFFECLCTHKYYTHIHIMIICVCIWTRYMHRNVAEKIQ